MTIPQFFGVLGAILLGNGITIYFVYALMWAEGRQRRGMKEADLPWWVLMALAIPPGIAAMAIYFAVG